VPTQPELRTARLLLRPLRDEDRAPLAAMNADPRVMEFFPSVATREESDATFGRLRAHVEARGFGTWAIEADGAFAGFLLLQVPRFEAPFQPCVEIGWRLPVSAWGKGYATEAARAALAYAFETLGLTETLAFTVPDNRRSRRVMEKLGMRHDPTGDFDMPTIPRNHRLARHALYRLSRAQWRSEA
jgi:ribosomal-protein-alanine N-acetyltransferase